MVYTPTKSTSVFCLSPVRVMRAFNMLRQPEIIVIPVISLPVYLLMLLLLLLSSGCSDPVVVKPARPDPAPTPVVVPPKHEPTVKPQVAPAPEPPKVAIVFRNEVETYREVAEALSDKLGARSKIYLLQGNAVKDAQMIADLQNSNRQQLVAIGFAAARELSQIKNRQIIFSYVFNYHDLQPSASKMKGISALPGAPALFEDWKKLSPGTRKVAVISGANLEPYIDDAKAAARRNNIELIHVIVGTDKEFLYKTKSLPNDVQGHWIIPDNRVLSRMALKEALTYDAKEGKQAVVFSPSLLALGGLFYSMPSVEEVSEKIFMRLQASVGKDDIPGEDVELLEQHDMGINPLVARQLGLSIPAAYKKYLHE